MGILTVRHWLAPITAAAIVIPSFAGVNDGLCLSDPVNWGRTAIEKSWEPKDNKPYYEILSSHTNELILMEFVTKMLSTSRELDPDFAQTLQDNMWDLV